MQRHKTRDTNIHNSHRCMGFGDINTGSPDTPEPSGLLYRLTLRIFMCSRNGGPHTIDEDGR